MGFIPSFSGSFSFALPFFSMLALLETFSNGVNELSRWKGEGLLTGFTPKKRQDFSTFNGNQISKKEKIASLFMGILRSLISKYIMKTVGYQFFNFWHKNCFVIY